MVRAGFPGRMGPLVRRPQTVAPILPSAIPGTRGWWDGTDVATITMDGSNKVSQFSDKSGLGNHATQGTSSIQPVYDPVKKSVGSPTGEGKLTIPNVGGTIRWSLIVARMNFSQRASSDGSIAAINGFGGGLQRSPMYGYNNPNTSLSVTWKDSLNVLNQVFFFQDTEFAANSYWAILTYFTGGGVVTGTLNNATTKTTGSGLIPIATATAGILGDHRSGWTDCATRVLAVGSDTLTDAQIAGLMAYGVQQATLANAA